jgi:NAD(P)-dependent dehydrogenase (short-subunit alcohol dehydrogenase family)
LRGLPLPRQPISGLLLEMSDPDWHDQIEVNLNGTANVPRVFAPLLARRGGGRIIVTRTAELDRQTVQAVYQSRGCVRPLGNEG